MSSAVTISVLLPVWNCPHYVGQAIESILNQSYSGFEFIIIDDGSTDNTPEILRKYQDSRIRFVQHANRGLAATLNEGIELARGKYIARQDQDDISLPDRLAKQVAHMEANPQCGVLGTWAQIMETDRLVERYHRHAADPSELRYQLLFNNPFVHSSVMLRKSVLDSAGAYSTDPRRQPPEDYELWSRLICHAEAANLPEVLLFYREIPGSMSRNGPSPFRSRLVRICSENIARAAGMSPEDPQIVNIAALTHGADDMLSSRPDFRRMREILFAAVGSISSQDTQKDLRQDVANRILALRGLYLAEKTFIGQFASVQGPIRSAMKRAYQSFRSISRYLASSVARD